MAERLLFAPGGVIPPAWYEQSPGHVAAVAALNERFEVRCYIDPALVGHHRCPPSFEAWVDDLRGQLTPDCHLVVGMEMVMAALAALDGKERRAASLTAVGFSLVPAATLRVWGLEERADFIASRLTHQLNTTWEYQIFRSVMGGDDQTVRRAVDAWLSNLDREYAIERAKSTMEVNLVGVELPTDLPVLYLDRPEGDEEERRLFARLVPEARVESLHLWRARMDDEEAGRELAEKVVAFTDEVRARNGG